MEEKVNILPAFLLDYQEEGVKKIINAVNNNYKGFLLSWDMGLGKTVGGLTIYFMMPYKFKRLIVLAPKNTLGQWREEIKKFFNREAQIIDSVSYLKIGNSAEILITNYESFVSIENKAPGFFTFDKNTFIILDEASKVKNRETKAAVAIRDKRGEAFLLALTGTPLENDLREFWNIMCLIDPKILPASIFYSQHCVFEWVVVRGGSRKRLVTGYKSYELFRKRIDSYFLRKTKEEVVPDMVKKQFTIYKIQRTNFQKALEKQVKGYCLEYIQEMVDEGKSLTNVAFFSLGFLRMIEDDPRLLISSNSKIMKDKQELPIGELDKGAKMFALLEIIHKKFTEEKKKVIIFSQYKKMVDILETELEREGLQTISVYGALSLKQRIKKIEEFEKTNKILLATDAFAYGTNLQVADVLINYDMPWNPARRKQRIDRVHRLGITSAKEIYDLISDGIDEHVYEILRTKEEIFQQVVEGREPARMRSVILKSVYGNELKGIRKHDK
jgi:SNF2 family DNA or RNA helicase